MKADRHPEWNNNIYKWNMIRNSLDGESKIKMENELYLPMPGAMALSSAKAPSNSGDYSNGYLNPNYHSNAAYSAYKTRASFPEFPSHIKRGLVGISTTKEPVVELPNELEYLREKFTKSGASIYDFYEYLINEVLSTGRLGTLADLDESDNKIRATSYVAESILDWGEKVNSGDNEEFSYVVLDRAVDGEDEEKTIRLSLNGFYNSQKFTGDSADEPEKTIEYMGNGLKNIPFVSIGSTDLSPSVDIAPLAGICRSAIQVYQMDADLRNAEYMTCNPALFITGINDEFAPTALGSTLAIVLPVPDAKAFYPQTDTSALSHVSNRIEHIKSSAMEQGAALLGSGGSNESGEALRIKQTANTATLVSTVSTAARGLEKTIKYIGEFNGLDQNKLDQIKVIPNTEFITLILTEGQQKALIANWTSSLMSKSTVIDNYRRAGMLQEGEGVEDEIERIEIEGPSNEDEISGSGENDTQEISEIENVKTTFDAYGIAVRAGAITPQKQDEEYFRKELRIPSLSSETIALWASENARRPVTLSIEEDQPDEGQQGENAN